MLHGFVWSDVWAWDETGAAKQVRYLEFEICRVQSYRKVYLLAELWSLKTHLNKNRGHDIFKARG